MVQLCLFYHYSEVDFLILVSLSSVARREVKGLYDGVVDVGVEIGKIVRKLISHNLRHKFVLFLAEPIIMI